MLKTLKGPFFALLATSLLTWATYDAAVKRAAGEAVRTSGRRGAVKMLLVWLAETLGPAGVLAVGGLLIAGCVAWAVVALRKPAPK